MIFRIIGFSLKWTLRVAALAVLAAVLAVATGAYIINRMFTPDHLTAIVADQLQQAFKRPVVVESVRVLVFKGIKIKSLRVLDNTNSLGGDLLSTGEVTVGYQLLPLLHKKLSVSNITVESPRLNLVKNPDGAWNFSDLFAHTTAQADPGPGFTFSLNADEGGVSGGRVTVRDLAAGSTRVLENVNFKFRDFGFERAFPVRMTFDTPDPAGRREPLQVSAEGVLNLASLRWDEASFTKISARAGYGEKKILLTGDVNNFLKPDASFAADLPAIKAADVAPFCTPPLWFYIPAGHIAARLRAGGGTLTLSGVEGRFSAVRFSAEGKADFSEPGRPASWRLSVVTRPFQLAQAARWWNGVAQYAQSGSGQVKFALSSSGGKVSADKAALIVSGAQLAWNGFKGSGLSFVASQKNNLDSLSLKVTAGNVAVGRQRFSALDGQLDYSGGALSVSRLRGRMNETPVSLRLEVKKLAGKNREITLLADVGQLRLPEFFDTVSEVARGVAGAKKPAEHKVHAGQLAWLENFRERLPGFMPSFSGVVHADRLVSPMLSGRNLYADFRLRGIAPGMDRVDGRIDAVLGPGTIYQLERMAAEEKALNVAFKPFLAMHKMEMGGAFKTGMVLKDVNYSQMGGAVDFKSGAMSVQNFYVTGPVLSAAMSGKVGWVAETLDLDIQTLFSSTSGSGGLSENLTDASGKPALAFRVSGSMQSPKADMDSPKSVGGKIDAASRRGVRSDFRKIKSFAKGG